MAKFIFLDLMSCKNVKNKSKRNAQLKNLIKCEYISFRQYYQLISFCEGGFSYSFGSFASSTGLSWLMELIFAFS